MRKFLGIFFALALVVALILVPSTVLADDPTQVDMNWDGSGFVGTTVNTGDATTNFATAGNYINGSFTATDSNNNPYNYGVDSFSAYLNANVGNGGYIEMTTDRFTSKESMYGPAGQQSGAFVGTSDGSAAMAVRTTTNYAAMKDPTYTYQLPGGHNIVVDGSYYEINRWVSDGQGNSGSILSNGAGSAILDCMCTEASGNGGVRFGWGCGCYTDANYQATGAGYFNVTGVGNDSVAFLGFPGLEISSGGGSLSIIANFLEGFSIGNYSLTAK